MQSIHNKWVLNIIAVITILNLMGYLIVGNINIIILFIVICFATTYISKNMTLVLGIPLILINLFSVILRKREGLENPDASTSTTENNTDASGNIISNTNKITAIQNKTGTLKKRIMDIHKNAIPSQGNMTTNLTSISTPEQPEEVATDEAFENKQKGGKYHVDYASTVEDAYDELNKVIGGDGIKRLTSDTQNLMKQQLQLAEAMKGMGPLIQGMAPLLQQAKGMLGSLGGGTNLQGLMSKLKQ